MNVRFRRALPTRIRAADPHGMPIAERAPMGRAPNPFSSFRLPVNPPGRRQYAVGRLARAIFVLCLFVHLPALAERQVADRVVARVNGKPILLSELRTRLAPYLASADRAPAPRRIELRKTYARQLLERRIDEILIAEIAKRRYITVDEDDIDRAIVAIAKSQNTSVDGLLAEALASGLTERAYRTELRFQLLEQRVIYAVTKSHQADKDNVWYEREKKRALGAAREHACIERLSR